MEGTEKDLLQIPVLGRIMLFLRGCQRPIWGFVILYIDLCVFSGKWELTEGSTTESAFWVVNALVLGFLFSERAVKNVMPRVDSMIKAKKGAS